MRIAIKPNTKRSIGAGSKGPIIQRVLAHLLVHGETGRTDLGSAVGCQPSSAANAIREHRRVGDLPRVRVCGWDDINPIRPSPRYCLGDEPDAPMPVRVKRRNRSNMSHARRAQSLIDETSARARQIREIEATIARVSRCVATQPGNVFAPVMAQLGAA
jgi:hypothetical protein